MASEFQEVVFDEFIDFASEKVTVDSLTLENYISTENMIPNKGGVILASSLPSSKSVNKFVKGDTLFSNIRTYFEKVHFVDFDGGASPDVLIFRTKNTLKLLPEYLYYIASNKDFIDFTVRTSKGAKMPRGDKGAIQSHRLLLPSLSTQQTISDILRTLDKKIELNRQINQTLEEMAQAIFKSWFVDFDPVKAKVTVLENGGTQDEAELAAMEVISGKTVQELEVMQAQHPEQYQQLQQTASLFPNAMQDSELGEIPVGWEVKPFGDMLSKTIGGDWGKEEPDDKHTEMVRILRGTDLPKVFLGDDSGVPTRYVEAKKLKTRLLEDGDIIIEVSGGSKDQPTGRSLFLTQSLMDRLNSRLEPASFCRLFRPITKEVGYLLAVHLMKIYADGKTWHYQVQSTGISNFQTKVFLEKEIIVVPNNDVLESFSLMVKPIFQKIHSAESNSLKELRDTLLPKLLSGELRLSSQH